MQLYIAKGTISIAAAIALEEAGLAYDPVLLDFATGAQTKPAYLAVNPKGRVPALTVPGGILTETGAILEYIAALVPAAGLGAADALAAARMRVVMYYVASTMHVNHAHRMRGARWADLPESHADMRAKVGQTMSDSCAYLEKNVTFGPFVLGANFSIADAYLYVACTWLVGDGVQIARYPGLATHYRAVQARPSVQKLLAAGYL
jgi:glutathione S-transferase